jgi:hypothetical protein
MNADLPHCYGAATNRNNAPEIVLISRLDPEKCYVVGQNSLLKTCNSLEEAESPPMNPLTASYGGVWQSELARSGQFQHYKYF